MKVGYIEAAEKKLKELSDFLGDKKYLMGDNLSIADFQMRDPISWHRTLDENLVQKFPNLIAYLKRFDEEPKMKEGHGCLHICTYVHVHVLLIYVSAP